MQLLTVTRSLLVVALLSMAVSPRLASARGIEIGKPAPEFKDHGLDVIALATEDSVPMNKLKPLAAMCSFPFVRRMLGDYEIMKGVPTN